MKLKQYYLVMVIITNSQ